jgi:hypothetical protein
VRGFGILSKYRRCLYSVDIRQVHVHENEIWLLGLRECDRLFAVPSLYGVMSNLCYEQREDLTRVRVIFHNENFLHWTFRKSLVLDRTGFSCPGFLTQVLSDSSLYAPALSALSNSRHSDPDQQKTGDDGQNNEQIKNLLRHCFSRHLEQC